MLLHSYFVSCHLQLKFYSHYGICNGIKQRSEITFNKSPVNQNQQLLFKLKNMILYFHVKHGLWFLWIGMLFIKNNT